MNKIGWCSKTWSPVSGCDPVSEACANCWAKRMSVRLAGRYGYPKDEPFRVTLHPDRLDEPRHWKKPQHIFVCSMSDFFHPAIPLEFQLKILTTMLDCPQHTFLVLTKRPEQLAMMEYACGLGETSNIWWGTTIENQKRADERIPHILHGLGPVHFVSVEPVLGGINTSSWFAGYEVIDETSPSGKQLFRCRMCGDITPRPCKYPYHPCVGINFVICGGETGPGARPPRPEWICSLRDQCVAANVPFWFKGWGGPHHAGWAIDGKLYQGDRLDGHLWHERPE